MSDLISPAVLIQLGGVFYILGFLVRDELVLRLLVLAGTALYVIYYFIAPPQPLWDAIVTSLILAAANVWVLLNIMYERTTFALSDEEVELYKSFDTLNPGQFRKILRHTIWHTASGDELLCIEGDRATRLYFTLKGSVEVERQGKTFELEGGGFIGEISFILNSDYSATVKANEGLRYAEWSVEDLKRMMSKNQAFNNAITALFNRDLATKLSVSHR